MKAWEEKVSEAEICERYHAVHQRVYAFFQISFDHFGATTAPEHHAVAHEMLDRLQRHNHLVVKPTEVCRCRGCGTTLADRWVVGTCPHCQTAGARGDQCDACQRLTRPVDLMEPHCAYCQSDDLT